MKQRMSDWFPYGLDAPPVVRNLLLVSLACWLLFAVNHVPALPIHVFGFQWSALAFLLVAASMTWSSRFGKLRRREKLLDRLAWQGDETVLDVGCGRGLFAVAAARRVPRGSVVGLDLWQGEDLSGNAPEAVAANARREGVDARVTTRTGDMREMPFADQVFDIVVSSVAIHNIYDADGRDKALAEIVRVLKPGGHVLIDDIRHLRQYATCLRNAGCDVEVTRGLGSWLWRVISFGTLAPGTLQARKPER